MAHIFADEDVPYRLQDCLRRLGHEVMTVRQFCEDKRGDAWPDEDVLKFACERRWAVLTFNVDDFMRLAREHAGHFGVILGEKQADPKSQARRINKLLRAQHDLRGQVIDTRQSVQPKKRRKRG